MERLVFKSNLKPRDTLSLKTYTKSNCCAMFTEYQVIQFTCTALSKKLKPIQQKQQRVQ